MSSAFWILATAFLWGATDPLLKRFGKGKKKEGEEKGGLFIIRVLKELAGFFSDWRYSCAFAANQVSNFFSIYCTVS